MEKEKKVKIFVLIISLIIICLIFFIYLNKDINDNCIDCSKENTSEKNYFENKTNYIEENSSEKELDKENSSEGSFGGGSGGGSSEEGSSFDSNNGENIPEDIYVQPCGYYYSEYGVCNGTCTNGICVSENRSCYCKN